jgi:hypothetical protein
VRRQPDWFATLRTGHLIRKGDGPIRIVRKVSRGARGDLRSVTLAIRRRSWTNRAYTILTANDLIVFGYRQVHQEIRVKLTRELDRLVERAIAQNAWEPYIATADDVVGVIS